MLCFFFFFDKVSLSGVPEVENVHLGPGSGAQGHSGKRLSTDAPTETECNN